MPKIVQRKCPHCGAAIPLQQGVSDVSCGYCGYRVHIEWNQRPPTRGPVQPMTIYVAPTGAPRAAILAITLLSVVIPLIGAGVAGVLSWRVKSGAGIPVPAFGGGPRRDVSFPFTCGINEEVEIDGKTFEGSGTVIKGNINCKITIRNSRLKGEVVVEAPNLVELTVENSVLEGSVAAVRVEMNTKLFVRGQSTLKGGESGIDARTNTEVSLESSKVEGGEAGIKAGSNFVLTGKDSSVKAKDDGLKLGVNGKVRGKALTIEGGRTGVDADSNLELELAGGGVVGGEAGVRGKTNPKLWLKQGARVTARETAVVGGSNLALEMADATVEGGELGVSAHANARLKLGERARVHGKEIAVKVGHNLQLDLRQATLESEGTAICGGYNAELSARGGVIKGREAMRFDNKPRSEDLVETRVTGTRTFKGRGCGLAR